MTRQAVDNVLSIIEHGASLLSSVLHEVTSGYDSKEEVAAKSKEIRERGRRALRQLQADLDTLDAAEQAELDAAVPRA